MIRNDPIFKREEGVIQPSSELKKLAPLSNWKLTSQFKNLKKNASFRSGSRIMWLKGQENYLISLDSYGRAVLHNTLNSSPPIILGKPQERFLKLALNTYFLYIILKKPESQFLKIYKVPTESLHAFFPTRTQLFKNLQFTSLNIEELDAENLKLVIKNEQQFEIWDLESQEKSYSMQIPSGFDVRYSRGMIIFLYQDGQNLRIIVKDLRSDENWQLVILGGSMPYFCEVLGQNILIGMINREMKAINYRNAGTCFNYGKCLRYYAMEGIDDAFLLLENGQGVFASNPKSLIPCESIDRIFCNKDEHLFVYSKKSNAVKVITPNGMNEEIKLINASKLSAIGINVDSQHVYLGCVKGKISVFE
ncbi:hypothetical protein SteCoe_32928 [Stentor coeruleus]|uniref:Uncharacterized protein n=1 Tax=Stentor coeruleus TaxID=5963 RepID=A0A1R2AXV4_9CILI|nr:hypothetical protein SteCoe_32928 [Stentor coeruleus]